jgi:hypothetical protein
MLSVRCKKKEEKRCKEESKINSAENKRVRKKLKIKKKKKEKPIQICRYVFFQNSRPSIYKNNKK